MTVVKYDPEKWLETTVRAVKTYVEDALVGALGEAYEVVMEFPGPELDKNKVPMTKTIVHFEIDAIDERPLGFGENFFALNYNETDQTYNPQEARQHQINFDVGVWASDRSGGTTARMRVRQLLSQLFGGSLAYRRLFDATDNGDGGVEIRTFSGGRFVNDTINDVPVNRMVDGLLEVRVFSRTPLSEIFGVTIESVDQLPGLTIPS